MDPITILIAGGLLGMGLGLRGSGKCHRCGRPMIESRCFWYSEDGYDFYGHYCSVCLVLTNPMVGGAPYFTGGGNWDPRNPIAFVDEEIAWNVADTYGFRIPEEMEMLSYEDTGENVQRCRICHSLFVADYMYYKLSSRGLFDDDHMSCFRHNQNQYGSYFRPDCLVRHRPDVVNPRTKETERFTLCKRCRAVWEQWGEYAYRVRHIRRYLPEWLVEKRLREWYGEEVPSASVL